MTEKPDLETVIRHYGGEITGLHGNRLIRCVAHDENTASMSVHLDKGVARCFACNFAGDAYTLIMLKEGCDFATAVDFARTRFGVASEPRGGARVRLGGSRGGGYRPRVRRRARLGD